MAEPFLGEIRIVSFDFAPKGWAQCNGQLLPINQNQALYALLGPNFGGDGRTNFALPDFRGRVPIHVGAGFSLAQAGGAEAHTLSVSEMPSHSHWLNGTTNNASQPAPTGNLFGTVNNVYAQPGNATTLHPSTIGNAGGSQSHENRQPYLTLNFCIALQGIFPSQN